MSGRLARPDARPYRAASTETLQRALRLLATERCYSTSAVQDTVRADIERELAHRTARFNAPHTVPCDHGRLGACAMEDK